MSGDSSAFLNHKEANHREYFTIDNGSQLEIIGTGDVHLQLVNLKLEDCLFVPGLDSNLVSSSKLVTNIEDGNQSYILLSNDKANLCTFDGHNQHIQHCHN